MDVVTDSDFLTPEERQELLSLLDEFFERWEELHRIIPTGDQDRAVAASTALAEQANKVRAFYG